MADVIEVSGLRKSFGHTHALDGLDLRVHAGEVHGFLGPNGAGKTTTIRILLGLLRADGGVARLLGGDPWHDATALHRRLAYVPGDVTLWPNLTGGEVIDLLGRLRGGMDNKRRDELIERFDLDPKKKARAYSKGNRQKVALVAALASDAELLILDEPTAGLDPLMEAAFRACIEGESRAGRSVLLSSHILSEVEALCERVTIIRAGRAVESGTLAELRHLTRTSISAELATIPDSLAGIPGLHDLDIQGTRVRCQVDSADLGAVLGRLTEAGVRSLESRPPSLEDLFLRHYTDDAAQAAADAQPAAAAPPGARAGAPDHRSSR
jgi:ABC-2 type transport system ATP-binding protein